MRLILSTRRNSKLIYKYSLVWSQEGIDLNDFTLSQRPSGDKQTICKWKVSVPHEVMPCRKSNALLICGKVKGGGVLEVSALSDYRSY